MEGLRKQEFELDVRKLVHSMKKIKVERTNVWSGHSRQLHLPPTQCLLHLHPTQLNDLPVYLPQASAGDFSYQKGGEGRATLLVSLVSNEPTCHHFPYNW